MTTDTPQVAHSRGCTNPRVGTYTGRFGDEMARCVSCGALVVLSKATGNVVPEQHEPGPTDINWPHLVAAAERRGIPVLRVDRRGTFRIIRSLTQLHAERDNATTQGEAA